MTTVHIFRGGNGQAVRLPKEFLPGWTAIGPSEISRRIPAGDRLGAVASVSRP
jgi:hypothetical protein